MENKLNVGCGEFYAPGWTNMDITREDGGPQPDIIGSVLDIPFPSQHFDRVYAGHVLEHITLEDVPKALAEFWRVKKDDRSIMIVGPDLTRAEQGYPEAIDDIKYGGDRWGGDVHLWESRETTMIEILDSGLFKYKVIPILDVDESKWPVASKIGWQFAIEVFD